MDEIYRINFTTPNYTLFCDYLLSNCKCWLVQEMQNLENIWCQHENYKNKRTFISFFSHKTCSPKTCRGNMTRSLYCKLQDFYIRNLVWFLIDPSTSAVIYCPGAYLAWGTYWKKISVSTSKLSFFLKKMSNEVPIILIDM